MKKKFIGFLIIFNFTVCASAPAQKQGYVWYFPSGLGLDFNTVPPTVLMDGQIDVGGTEGGTEGCGSIASANGELLFYANAKYIWNRKHEIMRNGDGLMGDFSSTNGAVIVPMPGENAKYYVFTTDGWQYGIPLEVGYSIVDVCGDNGYGDVMADAKNIPLLHGASEKLAVTYHANGTDYWLVAHKHFSNAFYAYLITEDGISEPVISEIGTVHGNPMYRDDLRGYQDLIGQMKISPDGSKLALVMENRRPDVIDLFNFDNSSGLLTEYKNLSDGTESVGIYGVAFSADQSKLYVNGRFGLYQFSLDAGTGAQEEIVASKYKLADQKNSTGGLQLGPDGKIYVTRGGYAAIIEHPNVQGEGCNFIDDAIDFHGRFLNFAFPTFIDNFDYPDKGSILGVDLKDQVIFCPGANTIIDATSTGENLSYLWQDGSTNPVYNVSSAGEYTVKISDKFCTIEKTIIAATPTLNDLGPDKTACDGDTLLLKSATSEASYRWQNGSSDDSLPIHQSGIYWLDVTKDNCTVRDSIHVSYKPSPRFTLGKDTTLCGGDSLILAIEVNADQYEWQDGNANTTYTITQAGEYSAIATRDGCSHADEILIQYSIGQKIDLGKDTVLCTGSALRLNLDPNLSYYWSDGSNNSSTIITEPVNLWVYSLAGNCSSSDSLKVDFVDCELLLPNVFSPNEDEYNPYFIPSEMSGIYSAKLSIYNRWGTELYQTNNFSLLNGWDGTNHNKPVSPGIYFWKVQYTDVEKKEHSIKGILLLTK